MARGRPRAPLSEVARLNARRKRVRANVAAFRLRQREKQNEPFFDDHGGAFDSDGRLWVEYRPLPDSESVEEGQEPKKLLTAQEAVLASGDWPKLGSPVKHSNKVDQHAQLVYTSLCSNEVADLTMTRSAAFQELVTAAFPRLSAEVSGVISSGASSPNSAEAKLDRVEVIAGIVLMSVMYTGHSQQKNRPDAWISAEDFRVRSLAKLRAAYDQYVQAGAIDDATFLPLAIIGSAMSDALANKSWANFGKHLQGIGALIENLGPEKLAHSSVRNQLYGYRATELAFALMQRRKSLLSRPEWIRFPWKRGPLLASEHMHTLLDVAFQLPEAISDYDSTSCPSQQYLRDGWSRLREIDHQLSKWKSDFECAYPAGTHYEKAAEWKGLHPTSMHFCKEAVAVAFVTFVGVRLHLLSLMRDIAQKMAKSSSSALQVLESTMAQSWRWARVVCQCMEYFFSAQGSFIGRLACLFPFDVAQATFAHLNQAHTRDMARELRWCNILSHRISAAGLPMLSER